MTTELEALRQKVAEAVARRDAAVESWKYADSMNSSPRAVTAFHKAHHTDIETMQALLVRLEAVEARLEKLQKQMILDAGAYIP